MQENKINIAARMMVSMPLLANNLDREDCPETVYHLLERNPEKAAYPVRLIAKNYIYSQGAKVKLHRSTIPMPTHIPTSRLRQSISPLSSMAHKQK